MENMILPVGTKIIRNDDKVGGTIIKFMHTYGIPPNTYKVYYVAWDNGYSGYPSQYDFEVLKQDS